MKTLDLNREDMKQTMSNESDPYAWIVLRLPKKLWVKAQILLEHLKNIFRWNVITGEIHFDKSNKRNSTKLKGSNIVQIIHHALDSKTPEPVGYKAVFPYMLKGCTLPKSKTNPEIKIKKKRLSKINNIKAASFAKDKMLWEINNDS